MHSVNVLTLHSNNMMIVLITQKRSTHTHTTCTHTLYPMNVAYGAPPSNSSAVFYLMRGLSETYIHVYDVYANWTQHSKYRSDLTAGGVVVGFVPLKSSSSAQ